MSEHTRSGSSAPPAAPPTGRWSLVVPVKSLTDAKSRLRDVMEPADRHDLVLSMLATVLRCCAGARGVGSYTVLTADERVALLARRLGARVVADPIPPGHPDPLNAALASVLPGRADHPVGVLTADLPELTTTLLESVLDEAARHRHSVVSDHLGVGTTMAFWTAGSGELVPRFGPGSAHAHLSAGGAVDLAALLGPAVAPARRDVDTPADVRALTARPAAACAPGT